MSSVVGASVTVPYRVMFGDTDKSGRLYWGAMFRIFEAAECELWKSIDAGDVYGWLPRVHAEADYTKAMEFDDQLMVTARLDRIGTTSAEVGFLVECEGVEVGSGKAVVVWVDAEGKPQSLRERFGL